MKKLNSKKFICLAVLLAWLLAAYIFWQDMVGFSLNLYLKKMSHDKFAGTFSADRIYSLNDHWILEHPQIIGHRPVSDGGIHFLAEKVELTVSPHFHGPPNRCSHQHR